MVKYVVEIHPRAKKELEKIKDLSTQSRIENRIKQLGRRGHKMSDFGSTTWKLIRPNLYELKESGYRVYCAWIAECDYFVIVLIAKKPSKMKQDNDIDKAERRLTVVIDSGC